MMRSKRLNVARAAAATLLACFGIIAAQSQQLDEASLIRRLDAAVQARFDNTVGYTVTERYAVYRNNDQIHPVAEMTVRTTYRKDAGKSYTILSQAGSEIIRRLVLKAILENEERINQPGNREGAWLTSANYEMKLKPGGAQQLDGRECLVLALTPRRKAPQLIDGTMWVNAKDDSVVQIQGLASKKPSFLTGPTQMMRQYANVSGFAMATHSKAISNSPLFGQTVITIDYKDYQVQIRPAR